MYNRRPDLEIKAHFFNQLQQIETRLQKLGYGAKTFNWQEIYIQGDNDEIILRNTYLNSQAQGVAEFKDNNSNLKEYKLKFANKKLFIKSIIKDSGSSKQIDPEFQLPQQKQQQKSNYELSTQIHDQLNQKQKQIDIQNQSPLQISPIQPQRSQSVQQIQHNFMDSKDQLLLKSQKQNQQTITEVRRPQTAPNQLKAPRIQTTPYKGKKISGYRNEIGLQPNSQFKPMKKRTQSPKAVYKVINPYVQRQFKVKTFKK
ncbi:unnamed protein product [Paramecium sonneborni]|uniref:Uncharacterized protein n=1 Tax=Paramecium sonneborni TaxID=65129 RepID=A0A8S1MF39_9CILI|nr:unnamed protein product [Paramecium sonneborni]